MPTPDMMKPLVVASKVLLVMATACCLCSTGLGADVLRPIGLRDVRVGGEIGRRIDITITNNLLVLDADRDFLPPFKTKSGENGYIGLGKLIDATVKLAA